MRIADFKNRRLTVAFSIRIPHSAIENLLDKFLI